MAKKTDLQKIYSELDKSDNYEELEIAFNSIKDFVVKKLQSKKQEVDSHSELLAEKIKNINGVQ